MAAVTVTDEAEAIELGLKLGYDYLARRGEMLPLTEYILPVAPFTIDGDQVEIRELIFDADGLSVLDENGRPLTRTIVRPLPA